MSHSLLQFLMILPQSCAVNGHFELRTSLAHSMYLAAAVQVGDGLAMLLHSEALRPKLFLGSAFVELF